MHDADRPDAIDGCRVYDPDADHAFPQERLDATLETVADDDEIAAYLEAQNVNPVSRKGYNDHGPKHVEIVRNRALCLYELLKEGGVVFNGASQQGLDEADEPVIVALAATLHDIGHIVHRDDVADVVEHRPEGDDDRFVGLVEALLAGAVEGDVAALEDLVEAEGAIADDLELLLAAVAFDGQLDGLAAAAADVLDDLR